MASDKDYIKTHQYSNKELEDLQKKKPINIMTN